MIVCGISFAQDEDRSSLSASFGGSDFHIKDLHASPLLFSSIGIAPSLQYEHKSQEGRHYVEASYYSDYLGTTADDFTTNNHRARLRYSYVHSLMDIDLFSHRLELFLGGSVNSFLCHSNYYFSISNPPSVGRTIESWYWSSSLDLSFRAEYIVSSREFLSAHFYMPVISNVSRPAYSPGGNYNYTENDWKFKMFGETRIVPKNFSLNVLLMYQRPLIGSFNMQVSYEFYYSTYDEPAEIRMYMNNLRAGLAFCF
jgi:hypothetical protein